MPNANSAFDGRPYMLQDGTMEESHNGPETSKERSELLGRRKIGSSRFYDYYQTPLNTKGEWIVVRMENFSFRLRLCFLFSLSIERPE